MSAEAVKVSLELSAIAKELTERLEGVAGRRVAFALIVFTEGRANYISNAARDEVKAELQDFVDSFLRGDPPAHKVN